MPAGALPRLHAAQTASCPPIALAWEQGRAAPVPVERRPTVCGGIEIERPARGAEILAQRDRLATLEGVYAEPTSAAALAALAVLARRGDVGPEDLVVVAVTGSGLKDPGPT